MASLQKSGGFQIFLIAALSNFLFSCTYLDIEDGNVPDKYLPMVQQYVGRYSGTLKGQEESDAREMAINISLTGNQLHLSSSVDFLGVNCGSQIGHIFGIKLNEEKDGIDYAEIFIEHGQCLKNFIYPRDCVSNPSGINCGKRYKLDMLLFPNRGGDAVAPSFDLQVRMWSKTRVGDTWSQTRRFRYVTHSGTFRLQ